MARARASEAKAGVPGSRVSRVWQDPEDHLTLILFPPGLVALPPHPPGD